MGRAALLAAASLAAIMIQLTMVNRLSLPGGAAPDLVLILVVSIALTSGPMEGILVGFFAGLALDIAPPASHLVGQYALVFCVAGYAAGRLSDGLDRAAWLPLGAVAASAAGGEALYAAVGMLFGDPGVTWPAVRQVLPVSVGYDLLVCPFVLYLVVVVRVWAAGDFPVRRGALPGLAVLAPASGAVRDSGTGRSPRLRAGAARHGDGWIGGAGQRAGRAAAQLLAGRPAHLRLRGGQAGSASRAAVTRTLTSRPVHMRFGHGRGGSASSSPMAKGRPARPVHLRLRSRMPGGSSLRGGMPGSRALGSGAPGSKARSSRALGSRALGSRALSGRVPRGRAFSGRGSGGGGVSRGGGSFGSGVRSGYGKGAEPHFRRRPLRGASSGGLLRPRRGRARFGRRSVVWRIGSKRTGGFS